MPPTWPFDQGPRVAALTTSAILDRGLPVLRVVHYLEDEDWAFTCGTTDDPADIRFIAMEEALCLHPTLAEVADLKPGWASISIYGRWLMATLHAAFHIARVERIRPAADQKEPATNASFQAG